MSAAQSLQIVVRQHNGKFSACLAKYSTKSFAAEVIPGAHEYINWNEDPEFESKAVRVILTSFCPATLRADVKSGLEVLNTEYYFYELVDLDQGDVLEFEKFTDGNEPAVLTAIEAVHCEMWETDKRCEL